MPPSDGDHDTRGSASTSADTGRHHHRTTVAEGTVARERRGVDDRLLRATEIETVGIVFFDAGGRLTDCNGAFLRMSGLVSADIDAGQVTWDSITAPDSRLAAEQAMAQFREIGRIDPLDKHYVRPDGTTWWALFAATRIDEHDGVAYVIDTTDRRQAEASRRASEAEFRAMFELSSVGQCQIDLGTGVFVRANLRFCETTGYAIEELARMRVEQLMHPDDRPATATMLERLMLGQLQETAFERRLLHKDGSTVWVEGDVTLMRDAYGTPVRIAAILRDVTSQKRIEQALAESRERLRLILESARDYAIFSMDMARRVTSWNPGAERITGYTEAEMLGAKADVIFTDEDRARGAPEREARTALDAGRALDERWHERKDGRRFWGSGVMMVMHDLHGAPVGLVKILRDQTEARAANEALKESRAQLWQALRENERARDELQAASRAKDHFLSVLSHELRTPLTPVLMAAQALGMRHDLPEGVRPALEMIQRNVRIEAHFIDDLLDLTRISRGQLEIVAEPTDLHEAVQAAVTGCLAEMEQKGLRLELALHAEPHVVHGDRARLQQSITNVLKNAAKFTPDGGTITARSDSDGECFRLVVSDTGIGIDAEQMPGIFDAFTQGGDWVAREYGGLGLGLAIARATVEAHGGSIRAASPGKDQGTTLTIEIPLVTQFSQA